MRFYGLAVVTGAVALAACGGGGGDKQTDTAATAAGTTSTAATPATTGATTPATTPATGATASAAPITGTTHEVKMVGDAKGYRFEPATITVKAGDGIKFTMVSGGPHNVAFTDVPADAHAQLSANMPNQQGDLSSPMLINPNETYTISFASIKPGTYNFHCTPHLAMGMKGTVTVQ